MHNAPQIRYFRIGEVKPQERHARLHNRRQRRKLETLLRDYGQVIPWASGRPSSLPKTRGSRIGTELDPGYVDVAIRRWRRWTGKDAVEAISGERFDALADRCAARTIKDQADVG